MIDSPADPEGTIPVRTWLRVEGAVFFALAVGMYAHVGGSWLLFLALFLVPDVGLFGYLGGARLGAWTYNLLHTYLGPVLVLAPGLLHWEGLVGVALIWVAHIGFDRMLGYGLKLERGFGYTHLGQVRGPRPRVR